MSDPLPYGGLELIEVTVETIKEVLTILLVIPNMVII